ncbi:MAG: hypothetical protein C4297_10110 [Gemmataceae bacterium]
MRVEPYDFRQPGRLAGNLEHRLAEWFRAACATAGDRWAKELAFVPTLELRPLVIALPREALAAVGDSAIAHRVLLHEVPTLLVFPRPLLLAIISGLLGEANPALDQDREFTIVEKNLTDYFLGHMLLPLFQERWPEAGAVTLTLGDREEYPRYTKLFPPDQRVIQAEFVVRVPAGAGSWHWYFPHQGMNQLLVQSQMQGPSRADGDLRRHIEGVLREAPVEITVELGRIALPLSQLAQLQPGDVVVLDQKLGEPLRTLIGGLWKWNCWPGRIGNQQAVQIATFEES